MKLRFEQILPIDRKSLFAFHQTPANLALLLEGFPSFRMEKHIGNIQPAAEVIISIKFGPLWVPFTFEHFLFEPPHQFGERQIKGPLRTFEHVHEFLEEGDDTRIIDHVEVTLPIWLGGDLAIWLMVLPGIKNFFNFREQSYKSLLDSGRLQSSQT
ncbi:MAG: hypothetical protein JKX97_00665 [Candidatus Lindowbacteria bacterium]|nr:hypothetical protein [Candidatus Lindowbacteria bacterium]